MVWALGSRGLVGFIKVQACIPRVVPLGVGIPLRHFRGLQWLI